MGAPDPEQRRKAFHQAISSGLGSEPDDEWLASLGKLWTDVDPLAKPSFEAAGALFESGWKKFPSTPVKLLEFLAFSDAFGASSEALAELCSFQTQANGSQMRMAPLGKDRGGWLIPARFAKSHYSENCALLLNEAAPQAARIWPLFALAAGAGTAQHKKLRAICPKPVPEDAGSRDAVLVLATRVRDAEMLRAALDFLPGLPASAEAEAEMLSACASPIANRNARGNLEIKTDEANADEVCMLLLGATALAPGQHERMLEALCRARLCQPGSLASSGYPKTISTLKDKGASELSPAASWELFIALNKQREALFREPRAPWSSKPSFAGTGGSTEAEADEICLQALRQALKPASWPTSGGRAPLLHELAEAYPSMGKLCQNRADQAIERMLADKLSRSDLDWRRSSSGCTQSIGTPFVNLLRESKGAHSAKALSWLRELAKQGLDFEAKSTQKSKSLGERLRQTQSLKEFWPPIEAQMLCVSAQASAPSQIRKQKTL